MLSRPAARITRAGRDDPLRLEDVEALHASGALESDGAEIFYCGSGPSDKVRAVRRPPRRATKR